MTLKCLSKTLTSHLGLKRVMWRMGQEIEQMRLLPRVLRDHVLSIKETETIKRVMRFGKRRPSK
jgi:hypothetical protein